MRKYRLESSFALRRGNLVRKWAGVPWLAGWLAAAATATVRSCVRVRLLRVRVRRRRAGRSSLLLLLPPPPDRSRKRQSASKQEPNTPGRVSGLRSQVVWLVNLSINQSLYQCQRCLTLLIYKYIHIIPYHVHAMACPSGSYSVYCVYCVYCMLHMAGLHARPAK